MALVTFQHTDPLRKRPPSPSKRYRTHVNAYGIVGAHNAPAPKPGGRRLNSGARAHDIGDRITVCVRKKPLSSRELAKGDADIIKVCSNRILRMSEPRVRVDLTKYVEVHEFCYDEVFDSDITNYEVYKRTAYHLVDYIFTGGKATCFAYGQTGSGKTHTMLHPQNGIYAMAAKDIFKKLEDDRFRHLVVTSSFYEIYQGHLHDLLNSRARVFAREDANQNVCINNLKEVEIATVDELFRIFTLGNACRTTGATGTNSDSSRSHAILQIALKDPECDKHAGKLSFIDLAGSERGGERGDVGRQTRMEGSEINKSLLALKECIRALDQDSKHTPFRQSKLTQVLKDSFVGYSRTCMIATISPSLSNSEHTLNTLRYADRVKELRPETAASPLAKNSKSISKKFDRHKTPENYELLNTYPDESNLFDEEMPESMNFANDICNPFPPTPEKPAYPQSPGTAVSSIGTPAQNTAFKHVFNTPTLSNDWLKCSKGDTDSPCDQRNVASAIRDMNLIYQVHAREMLELREIEESIFTGFSKTPKNIDIADNNPNCNKRASFTTHVWLLDDIMEKKIQSVMAVRRKLKELLLNPKTDMVP